MPAIQKNNNNNNNNNLLLLLALGTLATLAHGIAFTSPTSSEVLTKGSDIIATWTAVDTDPTVFSLYLWNFVDWPPYYEGLAYGIDTSAGEVTVRIPCHVSNGEGWQLTAINDTNVYVLYAQTDKFNITGASCTDPTTSSTCYAPASTVYVTQTGTTAAATTVSSATVTASVIQPGVADGSTTSYPAVSTITATALASVDIDISL